MTLKELKEELSSINWLAELKSVTGLIFSGLLVCFAVWFVLTLALSVN